jgi:hypothetical protein
MMVHQSCKFLSVIDVQTNSVCSIFIHGGFTNSVSDFDFARNGNAWQVLAVSEDNQIQSYIPARRLVVPEQMEGVDINLDDVSDEEEG